MTDPKIVNSALSQSVEMDGISVDIEIYRLEADTAWMLKVVDETGSSTVWDDQFPADQEALDMALETIKTEGIRTFFDLRY